MVRNYFIILAVLLFVSCAGLQEYHPEQTAASRPVTDLDQLDGPPAEIDNLYIIDNGVSKKIDVVDLMKILESALGDGFTNIHPNNLPADGQKAFGLMLFDGSEDVATGNGAKDMFFTVPSMLNGWIIVDVEGSHKTAGTGSGSETTTVQIYNVTTGHDILSTRLTIDEDETSSATAATAAVINTSYDDLTTGDQLRVDVDAVTSVSAPKGLLVVVTCKLP